MRTLAKIMIYTGALGVFGSCAVAGVNRHEYESDNENYVIRGELESAGVSALVGYAGFSLLRRAGDRDGESLFD